MERDHTKVGPVCVKVRVESLWAMMYFAKADFVMVMVNGLQVQQVVAC